ncbi:hypothetical protein NXC24_PB00421 (plasmid) [Rhizobium sp. NXC24]|nr:hypothetical protein NXC24_PB00421 [Rhizobium sp. NXC24]
MRSFATKLSAIRTGSIPLVVIQEAGHGFRPWKLGSSAILWKLHPLSCLAVLPEQGRLHRNTEARFDSAMSGALAQRSNGFVR